MNPPSPFHWPTRPPLVRPATPPTTHPTTQWTRCSGCAMSCHPATTCFVSWAPTRSLVCVAGIAARRSRSPLLLSSPRAPARASVSWPPYFPTGFPSTLNRRTQPRKPIQKCATTRCTMPPASPLCSICCQTCTSRSVHRKFAARSTLPVAVFPPATNSCPTPWLNTSPATVSTAETSHSLSTVHCPLSTVHYPLLRCALESFSLE